MWKAANLSFGLCPLLTVGAVELLQAHGSERQKNDYLAKLIAGEWTGTMNLTEPQAGSDVGALKTRAERNGDHYLIRSEEHTSELQSLMRTSYAVLCLKKKKHTTKK